MISGVTASSIRSESASSTITRKSPGTISGCSGLSPAGSTAGNYVLSYVSGNLVIRQPFPMMLRGLWREPERHVRSYYSQVPGCYFTNDAAVRDSDGHFWVTGRVDDIRIGVPRAFVSEGVDDQVRRAYEGALETLRRAGAALVDIDLPHAKYAVPVYYLVCTAEASSNLARYDGVKYGYRSPAAKDSLKEMYSRTRDEGFGPEVKRRIMLGTYVLSAGYYDAFYLKALQVRTLLRRDYDNAFERVDVVAMPTSPTPPFRLGEKTDDPLQMYLADVFTVSANLAGLPGISVPCGFSTDGLPIGFQLMGRMFDEATLLRVADAYEGVTDWHRKVPSV